MPLTQLAILGGVITLMLMMFFTGIQLSALSHNPAPSLVQLVDGQVLQVGAAQANSREPAVISRLVHQWATLTYNSSGKLPNGDADPGIDVGDNQKVTTASWEAAFVLSDDFRREFLKGMAELMAKIPAYQVFQGQKQTVLKLDEQLSPRSIGSGKWEVDLISHLLVLDVGQPLGEPVTINKKIFLRAVPPPLYPLKYALSVLQRAVYALRETGLEIFLIEDL